VSFVVPADYPATEGQLWLGFYDAQGRAKLTSSDTDGYDRARGPAFTVTPAATP